MQIQTVNFDDGLSSTMIMVFSLASMFLMGLFFALMALREHFSSKMPRVSSIEDLSALERSRFILAEQNKRINSKTVLIESPMAPPKKKKTNVGRSVLIQEHINTYHYINVKSEPAFKQRTAKTFIFLTLIYSSIYNYMFLLSKLETSITLV